MFVFGLIVGLVIGATCGIIVFACLVAGSNADDHLGE